jgi:ribosomal-protein-alanine acetyltransferase
MEIRRAHESDLARLTAISEAAGSAAHWSRQQWLDIFKTEIPARLAWIAEERVAGLEARAAGLLVAQNGGAEWELENIAVLPEFRRKGVGRELLSTLAAQARTSGAERILLEVRGSNLEALGLYGSEGFELLGKRRGYYRNPEEDALILVHRL